MLMVLEIVYLKVLKKILQYKYFYIILTIVVLISSLIRIDINNKKNINKVFDENELVITNIKYQNNHYVIELKGHEKYLSYRKEFPYDIGDKVKGSLKRITQNTIPNVFNYEDYLKIRGIFYELEINEIKLVSYNKSIINNIKKWLRNKINERENKEFLYAFIMGDTSNLDSGIKEKFSFNGLSYLLVIGTFKIMIITKIMEKIKRKTRMKEEIYIGLVITVFFFYFSLVNIKVGIVKSGLCYIIKRLMKYWNIKTRYYNIILLVWNIILLFNPYHLINSAFYYSFIISLGISLNNKRIKGNYFKRLLMFSIKCFLLTLPLNIYYNYEINILSIILNIIFIPLVYYIIFPLCIISFILPFFSSILDFFLSLLIDMNNLFSNITLLSIILRKPSIILIIIYYVIIMLTFKNKKYFVILLFILIIHMNINKIIKEDLVIFFDVGQGDSILLKNNNIVNLIDTGGSLYYDYDKKIIKSLKSFGINKVNNLIISHGDYDHMGDTLDLINNFKVEKVIFNCGEFNELENELINELFKKNIKYYSCIKELNIDKFKLYFLQTKEYDNENDNSNVIYTELNGYKFMFMGDASTTTEKEILNKYNLPNIDVLKVGHHGSKTSSSKEFINEINPKYCIISVGKNNRYGHPNKEVLNNLANSKIYRNDIDGSIMFKIKNNKLQIETCSP